LAPNRPREGSCPARTRHGQRCCVAAVAVVAIVCMVCVWCVYGVRVGLLGTSPGLGRPLCFSLCVLRRLLARLLGRFLLAFPPFLLVTAGGHRLAVSPPLAKPALCGRVARVCCVCVLCARLLRLPVALDSAAGWALSVRVRSGPTCVLCFRPRPCPVPRLSSLVSAGFPGFGGAGSSPASVIGSRRKKK
jgi:hypothetical protein